MKEIQVNIGWHVTRLVIADNALADAAYVLLKRALDEYERFKNDKTKTVEIAHGSGLAVFVVEHVTGVLINNLDDTEGDDAWVAHEIRVGKLKQRVADGVKPPSE